MTGTGHAACFHCGLPVPDGLDLQLRVSGRQRLFCCYGCQAVCQTILAAGLHDYYRHRSAPADRPEALLPEQLQTLAVYDHPDVQAGFVRGSGKEREAALILENIRCPACVWLNEQHLRRLPGVREVRMDYSSEQAWVRWDDSITHLSAILEAIADIGYRAQPYDPAHREEVQRLQHRRSGERLLFAGLLAMPVMQFSLASYTMGQPEADGSLPLWMVIGRWTTLLAVAAILAYPGQEFFVGAWNDLRRRRLGMDVPIALGLSIALVGSLSATLLQRGDVYFDSIAMLVFFVLLARRFELKGRLAAARALDRLARIAPRTATRLSADGVEKRVPLTEVGPGDRVRVIPGELLAVDGTLVQGSSSFDESVVTGESLPVAHTTGDRVIAGSRNVDQPVVIEVTHRSSESTISNMQRLLQQGLRERPAAAELADRVAFWFVPAVIAIAGATAVVWSWLAPAQAAAHTIAVLIVTCPCALALATPVALAIASGGAVGRGALPLRMSAFERLAGADTVVFDKTGTLTEGALRLARLGASGGLDADRALAIAAALEQHSEHPIARALRGRVQGDPLPAVSDSRNAPGAGVSGTIAGERWRLGHPDFAAPPGGLSATQAARLARWQEDGETAVVLANDREVQALLAFDDPLRPGVAGLLRDLQYQGVRSFAILSGDDPKVVARLAGELGIQTAIGRLRPEAKMQWVKQAQRRGRRVLMVGDGINDAGTLSVADVSVSFAGATELAQGSSDLIILGRDIGALASVRAFARRTRAIIAQNLAWAALYNLGAVPAAALGLVPPWLAAIGMSLSSLLVVGNSLRLQRIAAGEPRAAAVAQPA
ncbi:MAG: heavy metal translocating P-type ATPase [Gammaproteobacteria bacterium]